VEDKDTDLFNELAGIAPPKDVDENEEDSASGGDSMTERKEENPNLTDLQTFNKTLFPDLLKKWLNVLQVSRVFPDTYNHLLRLCVKDLMKQDKEITLVEAIAYVSTALSIAIDGEGRIDVLALSGCTNQAEKDTNKLSGGMP